MPRYDCALGIPEMLVASCPVTRLLSVPVLMPSRVPLIPGRYDLESITQLLDVDHGNLQSRHEVAVEVLCKRSAGVFGLCMCGQR